MPLGSRMEVGKELEHGPLETLLTRDFILQSNCVSLFILSPDVFRKEQKIVV